MEAEREKGSDPMAIQQEIQLTVKDMTTPFQSPLVEKRDSLVAFTWNCSRAISFIEGEW